MKTVPPVKDGGSFKCLGRFFHFEMSNETYKSKLLSLLSISIEKIDDLPLHFINKLLIYHTCVLSKVSRQFAVAELQTT